VDKSGRPIVLVVEDEDAVRLLIVDFLQSAGFTVIEAIDGAAAVLVLESDVVFNVLFTDISMPGGIDGVDLACRVCEQRPEVPVVLTSGRGVPDRLPPGGRFVLKPYEYQTVATLLRELAAA
jgi:two-component system, response regulator PdtaR